MYTEFKMSDADTNIYNGYLSYHFRYTDAQID